MNEDDEHALVALRREQSLLQSRLHSLEEQRRLHEKLGYSRYYLDMQLQALRGELALCQYRLRRLERSLRETHSPTTNRAKIEPVTKAEEASRYFLPVTGAFVVSLLAVTSAGLLWFQTYWPTPIPIPPTATARPAAAAPTPTAAPVLAVPTPQVIANVFAVNQTEGLNVRRDPGTNAPVLGILAKGSVVELAGDQEGADGNLWYGIKDGGWVAAEHLQIFTTRAEAEEAGKKLRP